MADVLFPLELWVVYLDLGSILSLLFLYFVCLFARWHKRKTQKLESGPIQDPFGPDSRGRTSVGSFGQMKKPALPVWSSPFFSLLREPRCSHLSLEVTLSVCTCLPLDMMVLWIPVSCAQTVCSCSGGGITDSSAWRRLLEAREGGSARKLLLCKHDDLGSSEPT